MAAVEGVEGGPRTRSQGEARRGEAIVWLGCHNGAVYFGQSGMYTLTISPLFSCRKLGFFVMGCLKLQPIF